MALLGHIPYHRNCRITKLDSETDRAMLDHPEKTARLLAALKMAVPFEVELAPSVMKTLQTDKVDAASRSRQIVSGLSYLGDEGGIMCHIAPPESDSAIIISLTHVRVSRSMPLATVVSAYQKHRVKKLKKQGHAGRPASYREAV